MGYCKLHFSLPCWQCLTSTCPQVNAKDKTRLQRLLKTWQDRKIFSTKMCAAMFAKTHSSQQMQQQQQMMPNGGGGGGGCRKTVAHATAAGTLSFAGGGYRMRCLEQFLILFQSASSEYECASSKPDDARGML
jgi:hypothetical protein